MDNFRPSGYAISVLLREWMLQMKPRRLLGIIPARYQSSRFPAKMLATIQGKSLLQHTYENAREFKLDDLVVATDDQRIFDHVLAFGGKAVMTSVECPTGTDRLAEVVRSYPAYGEADIVVNIQGDEPCLPAEVVEALIQQLEADPTAVMSTAVCPITSRETALNHSVVKCVLDNQQRALYFSRALIPSSHTDDYSPTTRYYQHLGIYAYRTQFLQQYSELPTTPLQLREDLEQLKILENGHRIKVAIVHQQEIPGVNLPEDIAKVEAILCQRNTSLSPAGSAPR
jgi:3-deoxy-manno-octulosonate cytidylyltransferase (CMP-KDO synthetase)